MAQALPQFNSQVLDLGRSNEAATAINVFVIAQQYGVWVQRASASVLITTRFSVVTVTALLYAIRHGILTANLFP